MKYMELTPSQKTTVNFLALNFAEIDRIDHFNSEGFPEDKDNIEILGVGCLDDGYTPRYDHSIEDYTGYDLPKDDKKDNKDNKDDKSKTITHSYGGYVYTPLPECHTGTIKVFEWEGISFYGAGTSRKGEYWPGCILIDLADRFMPTVQLFNVEIPGLELDDYGLVKIDWKDFGIPSLTKVSWLALVNGLKKICEERGGALDVITCCMGGHGRTGTALSILAGLCNIIPEGSCPVEFVRGNYCDKAVESESQLKYIEEITGMPVTAKTTYSRSVITF